MEGNMKKVIICIVTLLTFVMCFSACKKDGGETSTNEPTSVITSEAPEHTVEISHSDISLLVGETFQLSAESSKPNAIVFWRVDDPKIATVTDDGLVTALAIGQTICKATVGGVEAICLIKVGAKQATPMLSVSVPYDNNDATMLVGETLDVKAEVKLGDTVVTDATIEYVLSESGVVSVANGVITAESIGSTTLIINVSYNGQEASVALVIEVIEQ